MKKAKLLVSILYAIVALTTIACGFLAEPFMKFCPLGIIVLACLGVVYFIINIKAKPETKEIVIQTEKEEFREVKLLRSMELVKGKEREISETFPLIHVDKVEDNEIVIRVFKNKVSIPDSSVEINK